MLDSAAEEEAEDVAPVRELPVREDESEEDIANF